MRVRSKNQVMPDLGQVLSKWGCVYQDLAVLGRRDRKLGPGFLWVEVVFISE